MGNIQKLHSLRVEKGGLHSPELTYIDTLRGKIMEEKH